MVNVYLHKRGLNQGPYPLEQVKAWLAAGQVQATAMACCEGAPDWVPVYCLPGVKDDPSFSDHVRTVSSCDPEVEALIVQQTAEEIDRVRERLDATPLAERDGLQSLLHRKLNIFWKQVYTFKAQFPDSLQARQFEAALFYMQAMARLGAVGSLRKQSAQTGSITWGLMTGLLANQQEKKNAAEALSLLDRAIGIFDDANSRLAKASVYSALNQNEYALRELNYVIANFRDDDLYIAARQMKDEIEVDL